MLCMSNIIKFNYSVWLRMKTNIDLVQMGIKNWRNTDKQCRFNHEPNGPLARAPEQQGPQVTPTKLFSGECIVSVLADNNEQTAETGLEASTGPRIAKLHTNWWLNYAILRPWYSQPFQWSQQG